ncbi:hypothetical protein [Aurantimonas sp. 22II-16-19i]|uniref:hypothetical protein n=1 Tax=Aurantimonas sp. 22II-16-19i TaxID=1317114 RepID=UPI0009F7BE52|nr:hypothetical protein [Aurantimonas sp. 22II-16-19i]ORE90996.1 hypothetical protein ATO4_20079 [Aurantimonas sp. 22II-16-19i]
MSFSAHLAAVDLVLAAAFDEEAFEAIKMHRAAGAARGSEAVPDPAVLPLAFMGTLDFEPSSTGFGTSNRTAPDDRAPRRVTTILVTALVSALAWVPKAGDRLRRVSDDTLYQIAMVDDDETGRVGFWLNRIGTA